MKKFIVMLGFLAVIFTLTAQAYDQLIPIGSKIKLTLNLASSSGELYYTNELVIANGKVMAATEFNPAIGDKFCWLDIDQVEEIKLQNTVVLEVAQINPDYIYSYLKGENPQGRIRIACGVKPSNGSVINIPFTEKNISSMTNGLISLVH